MKIRICMKDPDGVYDSVLEEVERSRPDGLAPGEWDDGLRDERVEEVMDSLRRWFRWGEYVEIQVDTEAGTATVCLQEDRT